MREMRKIYKTEKNEEEKGDRRQQEIMRWS